MIERKLLGSLAPELREIVREVVADDLDKHFGAPVGVPGSQERRD